MKNIFFCLGLVACLYSCGESTSNSSNTQSSIDLTGFSVTELPGGGDVEHVMKKNADGKVLEEGTLRNGKRNGTWVIYNDRRPMPRTIANFVDDVYNGVYMEYSNTGQLELVCRYKDNVLHGSYIRVKNTRLQEEGTYVEGKMDGNNKKYYPNKDIVQQDINYKMGELHGSAKYFNENGDLIMEYEYTNGEKVSGGVVKPAPSQDKE